jgi:hypothetical protein
MVVQAGMIWRLFLALVENKTISATAYSEYDLLSTREI